MHNDRPFGTNIVVRPQLFGPKPMFETVHESGDLYEAHVLEINKKEKEARKNEEIHAKQMRFRDRENTRNGVSDTDRSFPSALLKPSKQF